MKWKTDWSTAYKDRGYVIVKCPRHPFAWKTGWMYAHRIVAEEKVGRVLEPHEVVHHRDGNKSNNNPDNIEVLSSRSIHCRLHGNLRKVTAEVKCERCSMLFEKNQKSQRFCSKKCAATTFAEGRGKWGKLIHGTKNGYSYYKCRCELCRAENARIARERRKFNNR